MRKLGDAEKALWQKVVESITPLHSQKTDSAGDSTFRQNRALPLQTIKPDRIKAASVNPPNSDESSLYPTRADLAAALNRPIKKTPIAVRRNIAFGINDNHSAQNKHNGLDGHWEKRFNKGVIIPDISIDLHGAGLQSAYDRLDRALQQARLQKLRVILLVTGRDRQYDRASAEGRGGIRAVMSDWLSASRHSDYIANVRNAHPRHGGAGALYIILRRQ